MPSVFEVGRTVPVGLAIEAILLIAKHSYEGEWEGQVRYPPPQKATRQTSPLERV
jgi:hypothetical protein